MAFNGSVVVACSHNYVRLAFVLCTLILFICHVVVNHLYEVGYNALFPYRTFRPEQSVVNDIQPTKAIYYLLNIINYIWQCVWLIYTLTYLFRRSAAGYLYLIPNTLTPTFYITFILGFLTQTCWVLFLSSYVTWAWLAYLISFLLLSLSLFILNNNLALNRNIYETDGLNREVWCLRFLAQNGIAFFASWTAVRFVLTFDVFLQRNLSFTLLNAGTVCLIIAFIIAVGYFIGPNINAAYVEQCAYQFSPWIVFILYFWGVVQHNWIPNNLTRNNIIAIIELIATLVFTVVAILLFSLRYSRSKIDRFIC